MGILFSSPLLPLVTEAGLASSDIILLYLACQESGAQSIITDRDTRVVMISGKNKGSITVINYRTIIVTEEILKSVPHITKY